MDVNDKNNDTIKEFMQNVQYKSGVNHNYNFKKKTN